MRIASRSGICIDAFGCGHRATEAWPGVYQKIAQLCFSFRYRSLDRIRYHGRDSKCGWGVPIAESQLARADCRRIDPALWPLSRRMVGQTVDTSRVGRRRDSRRGWSYAEL